MCRKPSEPAPKLTYNTYCLGSDVFSDCLRAIKQAVAARVLGVPCNTLETVHNAACEIDGWKRDVIYAKLEVHAHLGTHALPRQLFQEYVLCMRVLLLTFAVRIAHRLNHLQYSSVCK